LLQKYRPAATVGTDARHTHTGGWLMGDRQTGWLVWLGTLH